MTTMNIFDAYGDGNLSDAEKAEIARYVEQFAQLQREEVATEIRRLARQIMALSSSLSDEKAVSRSPSETDEGDALTVRDLAEQIHRRLATPRDSH